MIKKIFYSVVILFLLLSIGSAVALRIMFPPEKIKQMALQEISGRLGREVSVGKVSINIFTGISLSDFKCSEKSNFQSGTFVECKKFSLGLALLPLLQKQIAVDSIKLHSPKITVTRAEDGKTYNFSDLLVRPTVPLKTTHSEAQAFNIQVTKIKILDGVFHFKDRSPQKMGGSIQAVDLTVQGSSLKNPFHLNVFASVQLEQPVSDLPMKGQLKFSGLINPLQQQVKVEKLQWETPNLYQLNLSGTVENFSKPKFDIQLDASKLLLERLVKKFSSTVSGTARVQMGLRGEIDLEKLQGERGQSLKGQSPGKFMNVDFKISADLKDSNIVLEPYINKKKGEEFTLNLSGKSDMSSLKIEDMKFDYGKFHMQLNGDLKGNKERLQGLLNMDLKDSELSYPAWFQKNAGVPFSVQIKANEISKEAFDLESFGVVLGGINLKGNTRVSALSAPKKVFSAKINLDPPIDLKELAGFVPSLKGIEGGHLGADLSISGSYPFESVPKIDGGITLNNFSGTVNGLAMKDMGGSLNFSDDKYELSDLKGNVSGLPFSMKASLSNPLQPSILVDIKLDKVDLSSWKSKGESDKKGEIAAGSMAASSAPWSFPISNFKGKLLIKELIHNQFESDNIVFEMDVSNITPQLDKVSGSARFRTFGGRAKNVGSVEKFLKIVDPTLSLLEFQDIGGDFKIKDGEISIQDFWVESDKLRVGTEGSVSLPKQTCDINVLAQYSGRALAVTVPVSITGPLNNPKIEKKGISFLSQTIQEKLLRRRVRSAEEIAEEKAEKEAVKAQKIEEKKEEKGRVEEEKKEKEELKKEILQEKAQLEVELKKQKEEEKIEKKKEKAEQKLAEEEERIERRKAEEEERLERKRMEEEERLEKLKDKEE